MQYLDTHSRQPRDTLYSWLQQRLRNAAYFACQTGFFSRNGLELFAADLRQMMATGGQFHLVVGANDGAVTRLDLEAVLDIIDPFTRAGSLVLVAFPNVFMHPKTYYVEHRDGVRHAYVGSANFTEEGLTRHIEAGLSIDSSADPSAPFNEIRTAIDKWRLQPDANAMVVSRADLGQLERDGVIGVLPLPRTAPISPGGRTPPTPRLPPLPRIVTPPPRPRIPTAVPLRPAAPSVSASAGAPLSIVKRLSNLDTKGFRLAPGTPYIALPSNLLSKLPTRPYGKNNEPRLDLHIEARLLSVRGPVVSSGTADTNITGVGMGNVKKSHTDLRMNILKVITTGIVHLASANGVSVPQAGDLAVIDIYPTVPLCHITFITDAPTKAHLAPMLTNRSWGPAPPGTVPSWP